MAEVELTRLLLQRQKLRQRREKIDAEITEIDARIGSGLLDVLGPAPRLTRREKEVRSLILAERCNKEIASELNVSVRCVKFHVSNLLRKFGVASRLELNLPAASRLQQPDQERQFR